MIDVTVYETLPLSAALPTGNFAWDAIAGTGSAHASATPVKRGKDLSPYF